MIAFNITFQEITYVFCLAISSSAKLDYTEQNFVVCYRLRYKLNIPLTEQHGSVAHLNICAVIVSLVLVDRLRVRASTDFFPLALYTGCISGEILCNSFKLVILSVQKTDYVPVITVNTMFPGSRLSLGYASVVQACHVYAG